MSTLLCIWVYRLDRCWQKFFGPMPFYFFHFAKNLCFSRMLISYIGPGWMTPRTWLAATRRAVRQMLTLALEAPAKLYPSFDPRRPAADPKAASFAILDGKQWFHNLAAYLVIVYLCALRFISNKINNLAMQFSSCYISCQEAQNEHIFMCI